MVSKNNNFAVIDIGTNCVKSVFFINEKSVDIDQCDALRNKVLTQKDDENLDPQEVLVHIQDYVNLAKEREFLQTKFILWQLKHLE